jgi:tetratricopeptide (TPR) repeat protein
MLTHGFKCWTRNFDWSNDKTLFTAGIKVNHKNAKLYNNLGHAFERENNYKEALKLFLQAQLIQPDDVGSLINTARAYKHLSFYEKSEEYYLKAKILLPKYDKNESKKKLQIRVSPHYLQFYISYANLLSLNKSRLYEADSLLKQAIQMRGIGLLYLFNKIKILAYFYLR